MFRLVRVFPVVLLLVSALTAAGSAPSRAASPSPAASSTEPSPAIFEGASGVALSGQDAAPVSPRLILEVGSNLVAGYAEPSSTVKVTLEAGDGSSATDTTTTDTSGQFRWYLSKMNPPQLQRLRPGQVAELVTLSGQTISVAIPNITWQADVSADIISGTAFPNTVLKVSVQSSSHVSPPPNPISGSAAVRPVTVTADIRGIYSANFTGIADLNRGDTFTILVASVAPSEIYFKNTIAKLIVYINSDFVEGYTGSEIPNATLTLKNPAGTVVGTGFAPETSPSPIGTLVPPEGNFWTHFRNGAGEAVAVLPGYKVEMVPEKGESLTLTAVGLSLTHVNLNIGAFRGIGPANSILLLSSVAGKASVMTDAGGKWSLEFPPASPDMKWDFSVVQKDAATNEERLVVRYPLLSVRIGSHDIYGGVPLTGSFLATLRDSSGGVKDRRSSDFRDQGWFGMWPPEQVYIGDTVELKPQNGTVSTFVVARLTAIADISAGAVKGQGPPDSSILVSTKGTTLIVTSDHQGNYSADFSPFGGAKPGDRVFLRTFNSQGYATSFSVILPSLSVNLNTPYISGYLPVWEQVYFALKDASGTPKASGVRIFDRFELTFRNLAGNPALILPGDTIEVAGRSGWTLRMVAPELTLVMDPATFAFQGKGPPNSRLEITGIRYPPANASDVLVHESPPAVPWPLGYPSSITTDAQGNYGVPPPAKPLTPGSTLRLQYTSATADNVYVSLAVPSIGIQLYTGVVGGSATSETDVDITLRDAMSRTKANATTKSDHYGSWVVSLADANGQAAITSPGDTVEVTPKGEWTTSVAVPLISAKADIAADTVWGKAPAGSMVAVQAGPPLKDFYSSPSTPSLTAIADAGGNYSANFSDKVVLKRGHQVAVRYVTPGGHWVTLSFVVPLLQIQMNTPHLTGAISQINGFDIALKDTTGSVKATYSGPPGDQIAFSVDFSDGSHRPVIPQPGWTIEAMPKIGESLVFSVPNLSSAPDPVTDLVNGTAPVSGKLDVFIEGTKVSVSPDSQGRYRADFSGKVDIKRGTLVEARYEDPGGNTALLSYRIPSVDVCVNSGWVSGYSTANEPVNVLLKDSTGKETARINTLADANGYFQANLVDRSGSDVIPLSGQVVEMRPVGAERMSLVVPRLRAEVNAGANRASGEGPPNSPVQVSLGGGEFINLVTDPSGDFVADFSGSATIRPGSSVRVKYYDPQEYYFYWSTYVGYANPRNLRADISLTQGVDSQGFAVLKVGIISFRDVSGGIVTPIQTGIGAYHANISYSPGGMKALAVNGLGQFSSVTAGLNISRAGRTTTAFNSFQTKVSGPQAPADLAEVRMALLGDSDLETSATLSFATISNVWGDSVLQKPARSISLRRGDAFGDGIVDIVDAFLIAQYLAGSQPARDVIIRNAMNAASVVHDGSQGDRIDIKDAMAIAQMAAGLRDKSFN